MNFLPRIPSSSKKVRSSINSNESGNKSTEIEKLRQSLAEREVKILQDITNLSHKRTSFSRDKLVTNTSVSKIKNIECELLSPPIFMKDEPQSEKENNEDELDTIIKSNVATAIDDLHEESQATAALEYFGHPEIRITSRELKRAKGALWVKHWEKDPLPRNFLPDHFQ